MQTFPHKLLLVWECGILLTSNRIPFWMISKEAYVPLYGVLAIFSNTFDYINGTVTLQ
jgi:hypothetical protein